MNKLLNFGKVPAQSLDIAYTLHNRAQMVADVIAIEPSGATLVVPPADGYMVAWMVLNARYSCQMTTAPDRAGIVRNAIRIVGELA